MKDKHLLALMSDMSHLDKPVFGKPIPRSSRGILYVIVTALIVSTLTVLPASAFAAKVDPVAQAKNKVAQAQKEASQAAQAYAETYGSMQKISDELTDTQAKLDSSSASIEALQVKASKKAKDAYIRASDESVVKDYEDVVDETRRDQLLSTVSEFDDAELTNLLGMKEDLQISKDKLASIKEDKRKTLENLSKQKKALDSKLAEATKAQKALEAKIARDAKAAKLAAARRGSSKSATSPGTIINTGSGSIACPIQGSTAFTNDWGQPRSGGRSHKGTDIFSSRGTPNVAVVDGRVMFQNEGTGGRTAYVTGSNGTTYYYAHLNDTVGGSRSVSRGEVIGHTGSSGNASGGATHTHFEIRLGGPNGTRVNPYATLRSVC
ncbi:MAG: peptidoglycan DD-metalloendopeptidase family protein [Acidimicrobiia bacterium]